MTSLGELVVRFRRCAATAFARWHAEPKLAGEASAAKAGEPGRNRARWRKPQAYADVPEDFRGGTTPSEARSGGP